MRSAVAGLFALLVSGCVTAMPPAPSDSAVQASRVMDHQRDFYVARKGLADGYVLTLHIMPAPEGTGYSRTFYHLMAEVRHGGVVQDGLVLWSEVQHPDGRTEPRNRMVRIGSWYMARYDLSHDQGRHWLTVSFAWDGKRYSTGIYYPEIDFRR